MGWGRDASPVVSTKIASQLIIWHECPRGICLMLIIHESPGQSPLWREILSMAPQGDTQGIHSARVKEVTEFHVCGHFT